VSDEWPYGSAVAVNVVDDVDTAFVSSLCVAGEPVDLASTVACLLHCLPLLRSSNGQAKSAYLHVLPAVLRRCTDTGLYLPDCQQILSYALIHPAISGDELIPLSAWQPPLHDDVSRSFMTTTQHAAGSSVELVNGPTASSSSSSSSPAERLSNGVTQPVHRDLSAVRSLPVGLLHDSSSPVTAGAVRPSRTTAAATAVATTAGGAVYLQHSSPPPPGLPRALTPPRLSESLYYILLLLLVYYYYIYFFTFTLVWAVSKHKLQICKICYFLPVSGYSLVRYEIMQLL